MNRAFVKESDLPDILAERPIGGAQNFVTRRGAALIEQESDIWKKPSELQIRRTPARCIAT